MTSALPFHVFLGERMSRFFHCSTFKQLLSLENRDNNVYVS